MRGSAGWIEALTGRDRTRLSLRAGEAVFHQGAAAAAVYAVKRGRVRLTRRLEDGSAVILYVARIGETFAEAALFTDRYHCDALAVTDSEIEVIPRAGVRARLERDPALCLDLAGTLAAQVRDLRARLELRNIRSARERVLAWLRLQVERVPGAVELDQPWTAIAAELGLTHESVYRALAALESRGTIRREKNRVQLHSVADIPSRKVQTSWT